MNRSSCVAMMVIAGLGLGGVLNVAGAPSTSQLISEAKQSIGVASSAVDEARKAIENGKKMVAMIPEDSPALSEVAEMLKKAKENWAIAVSALDGAKESASKISAASSPEIAQDYKLLASVNASVALAGAEVVQTSLVFVEAVAGNKTEALDVIRIAMQNALDASAEVQQNYERVKGFIAEKYSK